MENTNNLIKNARKGDLNAYGELVKRFYPMAFNHAFSTLKDSHLSEDVLQESFVDAYRRLGDLRVVEAFPAWLKRIITKHCDRYYRRRSESTVSMDDLCSIEDEGVSTPERLTREALVAKVLEALEKLPERQRTTTKLFYVDGYSQKQIAEFMEVPLTTVKKRLYDAKKSMRARMMYLKEEF